MVKLIKKIKFLIGAGIVAYEVYDIVKRKKEKKILEEAGIEIESLEKKLALSKKKFPVKHKDDVNERRRNFRR